MLSHFLTYRASRIHYRQSGSGKTLIFCFHGYGERAESFSLLEVPQGRDFTLIAIDLPYHGMTEWREGLHCYPEDMLGIMEQIRLLLPGAASQFRLAGYSLGGRIALSILEKIPQKIEKVILLAPDGLRINGWYRFATQNILGNRLFKFTMMHPAWFLWCLKMANRFKMVNPSIYKFALSYIEDKQVRSDLYKRWTSLRAFKPSATRIRNCLAQYQIPMDIFYGRHDRMIRHETGEHFRKGIEPLCRISILNTGHQLLNPKYLDAIIEAFYS